MNNIIECKLESTYKEIFIGLWQYDYGQILRITGVEFPKAVEKHLHIIWTIVSNRQ